MLDNVILGRYIPGNSRIHRLDSRAKLLGTIFFLMIVFQANTIYDYLLLSMCLLLTVKLSEVSFSFFWRGIRPMLWIILVTASLQIFLLQEGDILFSFSFVSVTTLGIWNALFVTFRFMLIIGAATVLSLTTNPLMLADAIERLIRPLKKIGVPVEEIALIMSIAMRFVPTILDETKTIMNAQRSRGVDFNEGSFIKRIRAVIPILIPLFAVQLRRADELANAMEARGYQGGENRSKYRQLQWAARDTFLFVLLIVLNIIVLCI
ncbi:hypothetical protein GMA11_00895 [Granulicatella sp. zg-ZJ]|uniref:energy-coupling factor transporter transmembrane component T family protein n=1 Tax=unclassified Granulicatella TaxID=2630493 RepID=UPI0013BF19FF|nr:MULTISPECIES: energy-coupling factor transporter transmembrane protein EcfT [unclassified Granulicatella]MBS4749788.1 energy-coupling factor transporter transmembrane protein EcfT [Carnobacteriaceae bacterium zg-ZUI78]NEW61940.1 hypothetical protein [Granulicatella sp. zg-ZJ]NEW65667.1 hypothetical protein [Granulicatella sp. zg-84]QMI85692.1 energy-coupling factor transporter transmembrane protein EcfT [Carnobacteriaceae bacterium zg-84]